MTVGKLRVLLVADDGPEFGLGHLKRMQFLHNQLSSVHRLEPRLLSRELFNESSASRLESITFPHYVSHEIAKTAPAVCVFDISYRHWETSWADLRLCKPRATKTVGVDVPRHFEREFSKVIHPSIGASDDDDPKANSGPDWILVERKPIWMPKPRTSIVTIITGSQSVDQFRDWVTSELRQLSSAGIQIEWVIGKYRENLLAEQCSDQSSIRFVSDNGLAERLSATSIAITRFGVTAFELISRGVPTIILPEWSADEADEVAALRGSNVAMVCETRSDLSKNLERLLADPTLRKRLSTRAREFFATSGVHPAVSLIWCLATDSSDSSGVSHRKPENSCRESF